MTFHAFLGVLSAVITGLTIVKLLQGILWMIHARGQIKVYWVHLVWVAGTIIGANVHFWAIVEQRNVIGDVNFYGVADILWVPILFYLLAGLLFPPSAEDHSGEYRPVDLQDFYYKNHAWIFGTLLVITLTGAGMLRDIITLNFESDTLYKLVGALVFGALAVCRNQRFHMAVAILMLLAGFLMILLS
jgi:hypothetical protein